MSSRVTVTGHAFEKSNEFREWGWWLFGLTYKYVRVPREVVISNARLGVLKRSMELSIFVLIYFYYLDNKYYNTWQKPSFQSLTVWPGFPQDTWQNGASDVKHCTDMSHYEYNYSNQFPYKPQSCAQICQGESIEKLSESAMFFPTFIEDRFSDSRKESFLVKNVEELKVHISHGFQVWAGSGYLHGRDTGQATMRSGEKEKEVKGEEGKIMTIIKSEDGKECKVGGKSKWTSADVLEGGLNGPLKDWLACANIDLDKQDTRVKSGTATEKGVPTMRVSGVHIKLEMKYLGPEDHSEKFRGVVCYLVVNGIPAWNSRQSMAYGTLPSLQSNDGSYRWRYQHGITFELIAGGSYSYFSFQNCMAAVIDSLVMLQIPTLLVKLIAAYTLGALSDVYCRKINEPLNVPNEIYGLAIRTLISVQSFKSIVRSFEDSYGSNLVHIWSQQDSKKSIGFGGSINHQHVCELLQNAFSHIDELDPEEVEQMSAVVVAGLDVDGKNGVSLNEFVEAVSNCEALRPAVLGQFFDVQRRVSFIEKLFIDADMKKTMAVSRSLFKSKTKEFERTSLIVHDVEKNEIKRRSSDLDQKKADLHTIDASEKKVQDFPDIEVVAAVASSRKQPPPVDDDVGKALYKIPRQPPPVDDGAGNALLKIPKQPPPVDDSAGNPLYKAPKQLPPMDDSAGNPLYKAPKQLPPMDDSAGNALHKMPNKDVAVMPPDDGQTFSKARTDQYAYTVSPQDVSDVQLIGPLPSEFATAVSDGAILKREPKLAKKKKIRPPSLTDMDRSITVNGEAEAKRTKGQLKSSF